MGSGASFLKRKSKAQALSNNASQDIAHEVLPQMHGEVQHTEMQVRS